MGGGVGGGGTCTVREIDLRATRFSRDGLLAGWVNVKVPRVEYSKMGAGRGRGVYRLEGCVVPGEILGEGLLAFIKPLEEVLRVLVGMGQGAGR